MYKYNVLTILEVEHNGVKMNKILSYKDVVADQKDNELSLVIDTLNKKLLQNKFPLQFLFKENTLTETIWSVVSYLRERGWSVEHQICTFKDGDTTGSPSMLSISPMPEIVKDTEVKNLYHKILSENPEYEYSTRVKSGSFQAELSGKLFEYENPDTYARTRVSFSITECGEDQTTVEKEILNKINQIRSQHNYKHNFDLEKLKLLIDVNRRQGQSTALVEAAMKVGGYVIFPNVAMAEIFREKYNYDGCISIGELNVLQGKIAPIFIDNATFYVL